MTVKTIAKPQNMSQAIRDFAEANPVFGSDEIRKIYGDKAALLVSRLCAKGMFVRIKNGVFCKEHVEDDHPAYQDYIKRIYDALVIKAASPEATMMDKFYVWASERETFRVSEASAHIEHDMGESIRSAWRRGKLVRVEDGVYHYPGYIPADRRTSIPMAEKDGEDHKKVLDLISGRVMSAADIAKQISIPTVRLKDVLTRLVHDNKIVRVDPTSINKHYSYHLPDYKSDMDYESKCVLAIVAVSGPVSTLGVKVHQINNTYNIMRNLLSNKLIEESGKDEKLGGATYKITKSGSQFLKRHGFAFADVNVIAYRPIEREIITILKNGPITSYEAIAKEVFSRGKVSATNEMINNAVYRLIAAGVLSSDGKKPSTVSVSPEGLQTFTKINDS
jgi:chromosome segregation and condensation protein ScpB